MLPFIPSRDRGTSRSQPDCSNRILVATGRSSPERDCGVNSLRRSGCFRDDLGPRMLGCEMSRVYGNCSPLDPGNSFGGAQFLREIFGRATLSKRSVK